MGLFDNIDVNSLGDQDQAALMESIQRYAEMLRQQKESDNSRGVNASILKGQNDVDLARVNEARNILNSPAAEAGQPWEQNTGPGSAQAELALLQSQGRPQYSAGKAGLTSPDWGAIGSSLINQRNYENDVANAKVRSITDTRILSPAEQQARDEAVRAARLNSASGLIAGTKPESGIDPAQLAQFASLAGASQKGSQTSRDNIFKAASDSAIAGAKNQTELQKQALANQGTVDAATVTANGKTKLTKATQANLEGKIVEAGGTLALLDRLGKTFDPAFLSGGRKIAAGVAGVTEKYTGVNLDAEFRRKLEGFKGLGEQVFNAYRKSITGAAASEKELEQIRSSIYNIDKAPEEGKAALVQLMVKLTIDSQVSQKVLKQALAAGHELNPGSEGYKGMVTGLAAQLDQKDYDAIQEDVYKRYPALAPKGTVVGEVNTTTIKPPATGTPEWKAVRKQKAQVLLSAQQVQQGQANGQ